MKTTKVKKHDIDLETLKFWKYSSTKDKFKWLQDALEFDAAVQKANSKKAKVSK